MLKSNPCVPSDEALNIKINTILHGANGRELSVQERVDLLDQLQEKANLVDMTPHEILSLWTEGKVRHQMVGFRKDTGKIFCGGHWLDNTRLEDFYTWLAQ